MGSGKTPGDVQENGALVEGEVEGMVVEGSDDGGILLVDTEGGLVGSDVEVGVPGGEAVVEGAGVEGPAVMVEVGVCVVEGSLLTGVELLPAGGSVVLSLVVDTVVVGIGVADTKSVVTT